MISAKNEGEKPPAQLAGAESQELGDALVLLLELKTVVQRSQTALLEANLQEIYSSTARMKALLQALPDSCRKKAAALQNMAGLAFLQKQVQQLKSEIGNECLLCKSLLRRRKRTTRLMARMLSGSELTYSPQELGN